MMVHKWSMSSSFLSMVQVQLWLHKLSLHPFIPLPEIWQVKYISILPGQAYWASINSKLACSIESLRNWTSVFNIRSIFSSSWWTSSSFLDSLSVFFFRSFIALESISFLFLFCSSIIFCFSWKTSSLDNFASGEGISLFSGSGVWLFSVLVSVTSFSVAWCGFCLGGSPRAMISHLPVSAIAN